MNVLAHHRKVVRFIVCDGMLLFPDEEEDRTSMKHRQGSIEC